MHRKSFIPPMLCDFWDLSPLIWDRTQTVKSQSHNHWTARKFPSKLILIKLLNFTYFGFQETKSQLILEIIGLFEIHIFVENPEKAGHIISH